MPPLSLAILMNSLDTLLSVSAVIVDMRLMYLPTRRISEGRRCFITSAA